MKYLVLALILVGCKGPQGDIGPQGQPSPSPQPSNIQEVVNETNALRQAQGQDMVSQGTTCTLYTVPTTTTQIVGATLTNKGSWSYQGNFNVPNQSTSQGLNILPLALQPIYQSWYIVKCTGLLVITDNNWHSFDIASDDGSNLSVDGLLINNDGLHGIQDVANVKFLSRGVHNFEIDYLQATGNEALIVNMDGTPLPAANLYH